MGKAASLANIGSIADSSLGFRNRIINGAMVIDQRNAGASVGFNTSSNFGVDRFKTYNTVGSGSTVQRSTTAPAGFSNSLLFTVGTGASPSASSECIFFQPIEGFNVSDFGFGTASAASVTVSFQVRSSVTGTYAFRLRNQAGNRSYVATYTINSANTWETKSVTIAGDTSGTWATDNTIGILLTFDLGSGSDYNTTAGAWQAGGYTRTSGCVNFIATSGATFYITGVQLEKGSTATSFDYRPYGTELALCQRYFVKFNDSVNTYGVYAAGAADAATSAWFHFSGFNMRAAPTISYSTLIMVSAGAQKTVSSIAFYGPSTGSITLNVVSSGITTGYSCILQQNNNTSAYLQFSSEL